MRRHIIWLALLVATPFTLNAKEKVDITKLTIESEGEESDLVWVGEPVKFKAEIDCKDPNSTVKYAWKDDVADASPNDQLVATKTFTKASTSVGAHKATFEVTGDSSGNPTSSKNFTVVSFEPTFPPEIRIGEKAGRNKDTVSLEIKPAGVNLDFSSTKPGTADVSPATGSGKVTLTITGKKLSTADQDTKVEAKYKGKTLGDVTVTVVEPHQIATPHHQPTGKAKSENVVEYDGLGRAILYTLWYQNVNITVHDQFDKPLSKVWDGAVVTEKGHQIGLPAPTAIKSSGYTDPCGLGNQMEGTFDPNDAKVKSWPTSADRIVGPSNTISGDTPVEVEGISLKVPVVNRSHEYIKPDTINIIWP